MIESEEQYEITRQQVGRFLLALQQHDAAERPDDIAPPLWQAMRNGMATVTEELITEMDEWKRRTKVPQTDEEKISEFAARLGMITGMSSNKAIVEYFKARGMLPQLDVLRTAAMGATRAFFSEPREAG